MNKNAQYLGVDIGSVSIAIALVDERGEAAKSAYRFHYGKIAATLESMLAEFDAYDARGIACTASSPGIITGAHRYDGRIAVITAARRMHGKPGSILMVGGERFGLIRFDEDGSYRRYRANSSCAAGTGSFLDQQARRLGLPGIEELSAIACASTGDIPRIASRCAVFAKTDLIHAQQEGYTLAQICDGLCHGLAKNIVDTLCGGEELRGPVIFAGGVARNAAVVKHLERLMGTPLVAGERAHLYGAIGAALCLAGDESAQPLAPEKPLARLVAEEREEKRYYYAPLELTLSDYPEFPGIERYNYDPAVPGFEIPVEVDIYEKPARGAACRAFLGIDIGSTSTKAALLDGDGRVLAGFYTRTAGRPLAATQAILEAIEDAGRRAHIPFDIAGAGTTGSGRKFIGKIMGADLVLDEITAHARAAATLDPEIDTIIEIGGQDAKFTTLRNGTVTFSIMNSVCAAGTGSFVEEQAQKLSCPLDEYAERAGGARAPIASDRCTVFMERDINHLLNKGYEVPEILATVLHSVRDNYLSKVAIEANIGERVCFQGATAKNRALVAAFEQKLGKPIFVSRFCHITGALGVALSLAEDAPAASSFRGLSLHGKRIPLGAEVCDLCTNHCKIKTAHVDGETVAYGFLCGRDYDTKKFVNKNASGFDLLRARRRAAAFPPTQKNRGWVTLGIPAALHMFDELPLWRKFFDLLGVRTVTSEDCADPVKRGKERAGAEFCAPMSAMYGHASWLSEHADYVFMPVYLEGRNRSKERARQYCYYTQYSPAIMSVMHGAGLRSRTIMPLVNHAYSHFHTAGELVKALRPVLGEDLGFVEVYNAYEDAIRFQETVQSSLRAVYARERESTLGGVSVVLLGRPYTVLAPSMNKGIPDIFATLGIKTFYQDMVEYSPADTARVKDLLAAFHWNFASKIIETAEAIATRPGVYPVLVTSFKCSPDSYVVEYFKRIMDHHGKPYLVLQLDEHDSSVGYETRIESAVRAFRNHHSGNARRGAAGLRMSNPKVEKKIAGKTLLFPNWDPITGRFLVANLRSAGIDARLLEENDTLIQKSLRHNTGQCIPMNAIAQEFMDYVRAHELDPANTLLWMLESGVACNIRMYPYYIKSIFEAEGGGMEKAGVYVGDVTFLEFPPQMMINAYFAYLFGGLIRKAGCTLRPYEEVRGATDAAIARATEILEAHFLGKSPRETAVRDAVAEFENVAVKPGRRPKVAIFGDLYARDNDVMNQNLVRAIEAAGGEALTTPYSDYAKVVAGSYFKRWLSEGKYKDVFTSRAMLGIVGMMEKKYYRYFEKVLKEPMPSYDIPAERILARFGLKLHNNGETHDNILKIFALLEHYPDIALFVQTSPAFCCPSLVSEAMSAEIERATGVPVISVTYDGTGSLRNDVIVPYLAYPRKGRDLEEKKIANM
ncbi:MAG: CoA activase [Spirochaetes bacterium]|nr:MAG: CoA activase [Spirochaetota bacterium]